MFSKIKNSIARRKLQRATEQIKVEKDMQTQEKEIIEQENQIYSEKYNLKQERKRVKFPSWSKLLLVFLFINFTLLELFTGYITLRSFNLAAALGEMPDLTPLITLITTVIGETISYGVYIAKAKAENIKNGIVYETTMYNLEHNEDDTLG